MNILKGNDTSTTLDLLRAVAAQAVCVIHAVNLFDPSEKVYPSPAVIGVMVFFILSGFVIAHTLSNKDQGFTGYAIDRISRIYTGYLPALLLVLVVDYTMMQFVSYDFAQHWSVSAFFGNLFLMQATKGPLDVPAFGSALPFWSVAIEFHIYLFVGAVYYLHKSKNVLGLVLVAVLFANTPMMYFLNNSGLFSLWLMGFAAYFLIKSGYFNHVPTWTLSVLGIISFAYFLNKLDPWNMYSLKLYPLLGFAFVCLISVVQRTNVFDGRGEMIRGFADYSYSLYLLHHTLVWVVLKLWPFGMTSGIAASIIVANVGSYGFYYLTERNYRKVGYWIKSTSRELALSLEAGLLKLRDRRTKKLVPA